MNNLSSLLHGLHWVLLNCHSKIDWTELTIFSAGLIWFFLRTAGWCDRCNLSCWKFFPEFVKLKCPWKMKCFFLSIFSANCILNLSQDGRLVWLLSSFLLKMINVLYQEVVFESLSGRLLDGVTVVTFLAGRRNAARYFTFSPHTTPQYTIQNTMIL